MPIIIGIVLIPIIVLMIIKSNSITTNKMARRVLDILMIVISIAYLVCCLGIKSEVFDFVTTYSVEYMFLTGEYILNLGIVIVFSPFIWIVVIHFLRKLLRSIRVRKNAIIKKDEDYIYYRGDLDKVSPSTIMFVSTYEVNTKKSISATILKLKLLEYIVEKNDTYVYTNKDESTLLESERMVLNLIRDNSFDEKLYKKVIEREAMNARYAVKNWGGIPVRIVKILITIAMVFVVFIMSVKLDDYTFENYHVYPEKDGTTYIQLKNKKDIEELSKEVKDKSDYYSRTLKFNGKETLSYSYNQIRATKLEYGVVRKAFALNMLNASIIGFIGVYILISLYYVIEQIINIKKNYRRTIKGKVLLNKAYALKNYLKNYSLIEDRTERELILWEYYLIYAVTLGINVKIEDKVIEKYVSGL